MSTRFTPSRVETAFWLTICGGLLTGIGIETDWGRQFKLPSYSDTNPQGGFEKPVLAEPYRLPPPDSMLETALRPLFSVTRRPAPTADVPKQTMNKGQFILTGVSIVPQGKFAFLLEKAGNRGRVVAEGKEINGITVKEVSADQVLLFQNDDTEILPLRTAKGLAVSQPLLNSPAISLDSSPPGAPALQKPSAPPSADPASIPPNHNPPSTPPPQKPPNPPGASPTHPAKGVVGPL